MARDAILALNAGSSSVKFALFGGDRLEFASHGEVEGIGGSPHFLARDPGGASLAERRFPQDARYRGAAGRPARLRRRPSGGRSAGRGRPPRRARRRQVRPARADRGDVLAALDALTPLAPLHQPHNLAAIRALAAGRPDLPQVACFDTAFHRDHADVATPLRPAAAPARTRASGATASTACPTSIIARRAARARAGAGARAGRRRAPRQRRQPVRHARRRSVDTTMGFTALDGLPMGTRCGSLDPGVLLYLMQQQGMGARGAGRPAVSRSPACSASRAYQQRHARPAGVATTRRRREAVDLFVYRIVRETGAMAACARRARRARLHRRHRRARARVRAAVCRGCAGSASRSTRRPTRAARACITTPVSRAPPG